VAAELTEAGENLDRLHRVCWRTALRVPTSSLAFAGSFGGELVRYRRLLRSRGHFVVAVCDLSVSVRWPAQAVAGCGWPVAWLVAWRP